MELNVVCCGPLERLTGQYQLPLQLPDDATVADVYTAIATQFPEAQDLLTRCAVAVGSSLVGASTPLSPGDVVAILPPVAGG